MGIHQGLDPVFIKVLLRMKSIKMADIARERDVTRGLITQVINGDVESFPTKNLIAKKLGLPYEVLWGSRPKKEAA